MLYYCPLESYKERYTMQWSAPVTGWLERNWLKIGLPYTRVEGSIPNVDKPIKIGCVLDAVKRSNFAFSQVSQLLEWAEDGKITDRDCIYFDDFWHPGIEALPYAFHLFGIRPKMFAFLHAQSVDEFDFTHPMRHWMRFFEQGIAAALNGIFVCGPCLRDLVVYGGIAPKEKVHVTGHPFNSEEVLERMSLQPNQTRENRVVYSSRWDSEKNPQFFLEVAKTVLAEKPDAVFVVCSSAKELRSNEQRLLDLLAQAQQEYPGIRLLQGLSKEQYYSELKRAKIQINTADQDFVAITLLEAGVAGCYPIYPYFRSFPETFLHHPGFMYERLDVEHASKMVLQVLNRDDLWTPQMIEDRSWIYRRFDSSWLRMLEVMGYEIPAYLAKEAGNDPYQE